MRYCCRQVDCGRLVEAQAVPATGKSSDSLVCAFKSVPQPTSVELPSGVVVLGRDLWAGRTKAVHDGRVSLSLDADEFAVLRLGPP